MRLSRSLLGVALVGGGLGCGGLDEPEFGDDATWTVFVYGHADHSLSPNLAIDLEEIEAAPPRDNVNVIVYADWDASSGYPAGTQWFRARDGRLEMVESAAEANLDDPAMLTAAVEKAFSMAPSDRRALVLWDHGGGWELGYGGDTENGTIVGRGVGVPAVADAVKIGLDRAGVERRLDLLSFDTCLLGSAESAAELMDVADLFIANGELDYGPGHDYVALLTYLGEHPGTRLEDLANAESSAYGAHHQGTLMDRMLHAHIALDLDQMPEVMERAAALVEAVDSPAAALAVGRAVFASAPGYFTENFSPEQERGAGLRDLGQLADLLAASDAPRLADAAEDLRDSLDGLVLAGSRGDLRDAQIGMNVELTPPNDVTSEHIASYGANTPAWNGATGWSSLIQSVATFGDDIAPRVSGSVLSSRNTIEFRVDDPDIADVWFELGIIDDGDVEYGYGYVTSSTVPNATTLQMAWSGEVWAMQTSGGLEAVYVEPWGLSYAPDGSPRLAMMFTPGVIIDNGEETFALLVFDTATGTAPLFSIPVPNSTRWSTADVSQYRGRMFRPLLQVWDANGNADVVRLDSITIGDNLRVVPASMTAGGYRMNLLAADLWGNASLVPFDLVIGGGSARRSASRHPARRRGEWLTPLVDASRARELRSDSFQLGQVASKLKPRGSQSTNSTHLRTQPSILPQ